MDVITRRDAAHTGNPQRMRSMKMFRTALLRGAIPLAMLTAACHDNGVTAAQRPVTITPNPCTPTGTLTLDVATSARIDCSAGGTTLTLAGNGASYMIVPQLATDQGTNQFIGYQLFTGNVSAASASLSPSRASRAAMLSAAVAHKLVPPGRNMSAQYN